MKRIGFVVVVLAALVGCGQMNSHDLSEWVKGEMQRDLVKNVDFDGLRMERVALVHQEGVKYVGVGEGTMKGVPVKFDVTCDYDGHTVVWKSELRDSLAVYGKIKGGELKTKAGEAWSATRDTFKKGYDKTAAAADEFCDGVKGFFVKDKPAAKPPAQAQLPPAQAQPPAQAK